MTRFRTRNIVILGVLLLIVFAGSTLAALFPIYQKSKRAYASFEAALPVDYDEALTHMEDITFVTFRKKMVDRLFSYRLDLALSLLAENRYTEAMETAILIGDAEKIAVFNEQVTARYLESTDPLLHGFLRRFLVDSTYGRENAETDVFVPFRSLAAVGKGFALAVTPEGKLEQFGSPPADLAAAAATWEKVAAVAAHNQSAVITTTGGLAESFGDNSLLQMSVGGVNRALSPSLSATHTAITRADRRCFVTNLQGMTNGFSVAMAVAGTNYTAGLSWYGRPVLWGENPPEEAALWTEIVLLAAGGNALYGLRLDGTLLAAQSPFKAENETGLADISAADGKLLLLRNDGTAKAFGYAENVTAALESHANLAAVFAGEDGVLVRDNTGRYHYIPEKP